MISRPSREFQLGGRLSLDLTWTLRYRAVRPTELLESPRDLAMWLGRVALPVSGSLDEPELSRAKALREAVHRAASAIAERRRIDSRDRQLINRLAAAPPPAPSIGPDGKRRVSPHGGDEFGAALSAIARDAIDLLTAGDGRLRRCEGPRCSLLFHDGSRPGARRWCATTRCGNRVNTRTYRARKREMADDD